MTRRSYKTIYRQLLSRTRRKGLHVHAVHTRVTKDFAGMNTLAAKAFGLKLPPNTIQIDSDLNYKEKCHTLWHEVIEFNLMRKGMKYWPAHKIALRLERKPPQGGKR